MHPSLLRRICTAGLLLGGFWFGHPAALAQPAWASARTVGRGALFAGTTVSGGASDAAGNFYEVGTFLGTTVVDGVALSSRGADDSFLAKYSPAGALLWVRQLGSVGSEMARDVALDGAGNAYVVGEYGQTLDLGGPVLATSTAAGFVARYSPQGVAEWAVSIDNPGVMSVTCDGLGQVYVGGTFANAVTIATTQLRATGAPREVFLARFSDTGTLQGLTSAFHINSASPTADLGHFSLASGPTGGLYLAGDFYESVTSGATTVVSQGDADGLVIKYSAQGVPLWVQHFGGGGPDFVQDAALGADGSLYLAGTITQGATFGATALAVAGGIDTFVAKYGPTGTPLWAQAGGGPGNDEVYALAVDGADNAYAAGYFTGTARYGPHAVGNPARQTALVVAYSPQGLVRWAQHPSGGGGSSGYHLGLDAGGGVYVTGKMSGTLTFGTAVLAPATGETFLARLGASALAARPARAQPLGLYPNPATAQVRVSGLPIGTPVHLLDALGRTVRTAVLAADATVSVQGLAPGLYTLRATGQQAPQYAARVRVE